MPTYDMFKDDVSCGRGAVSVTGITASGYSRCRAVFIGTSQSLDFSFDGTNWVTFQNCVAGTVLPIQVKGARKTTGPAAPTAGDVVFIY